MATSTTSSTTQGDWVSIGADKRTLRFGAKNGRPGDYIQVITRASNPIIDFNLTSSEGAESVSSAALTVDLSFPLNSRTSQLIILLQELPLVLALTTLWLMAF